MYDDTVFFCPNHPLQPFPLVLFCLVFFFFKQIEQTQSPQQSIRGNLQGT